MADGRSTARLKRAERSLAYLRDKAADVDPMVKVEYEDEYRHYTVHVGFQEVCSTQDVAQVSCFLDGMKEGLTLVFYRNG